MSENTFPSAEARGPIYKAFLRAWKDPKMAMSGVSVCYCWLASFGGHPSAEPEDRLRRLSSEEQCAWLKMYGDEAYFEAQWYEQIPIDAYKQVMAECRQSLSLAPLAQHPTIAASYDTLAGLFVRRVIMPHAIWHDRSPWADFDAAVNGDESALKRLVMIDRTVLESPAIRSQWDGQMQADRLLRERIAYADLKAIDEKLDADHRRKTGKLRFTKAVRTRMKLRFAAHLQLLAKRQGKRLMPRHITDIFNAIYDEFGASAEARHDLPVGESLRVELSRIRSQIEPRQS